MQFKGNKTARHIVIIFQHILYHTNYRFLKIIQMYVSQYHFTDLNHGNLHLLRSV